MKSFFVLLMFVFVHGQTTEYNQCKIKPSEEVDWDRLTGLWYLTSHHQEDHLTSDNICIATTYFGIVGDGISFFKHVISKTGDPEMKLISYPEYYLEDYDTGHGVVFPQPVSQLKYMKDTLYLRPSAVVDVFTELIQRYRSPATFSTDYDTYYMIEQCDVEGKRMVHVYTRSQNPSEKEMKIIRKAIESRGIETPILFSDACVDIGLFILT